MNLRWGDLLLLLVCLCVATASTAQRAVETALPHERFVVTTNGDSFPVISLREFGTTGYGRLLAEYNNLSFSTIISAGLVIRIPVSKASDSEGASVVFAKGDSVVFIRGKRRQADAIATGDVIYPDDIVKTANDGYVSLRFPSGTVINVQPNSEAKLLQLDCLDTREMCIIGVDAVQGSFRADVNQRSNQPTEVNFQTPHASAAVRGTVFDIDVSTEMMLLGVTEGAVDVTAQGNSTGVLQGLGVRTRAGEPSDPPIPLLTGPDFRRDLIRFSFEDTLRWLPLENAVGYVLSIMQDELGATQLYSVVTTDLIHQMWELPAGVHFAHLRAIDSNGFNGFVTRLAINIVAVKEDAFVPALGQTVDNGILLLSVADLPADIAEYEVQSSYQEDFRELSSVDVPADGGIQVAPAQIPTYFRARSLIDTATVGRFSPVMIIPAQ